MEEKLESIIKNIAGIADDSRKVENGFAFFAIRGSAFDGHKFIPKAIENGAKYIFGEINEPDLIKKNVEYIKVNDSREYLAKSAKIFYDDPSSKIKMIGVTGTNGKTTISNLIYQLLQNIGKKSALIGTNGIYLNNTKIDAKLTTPGIIELNELLNKAINENCDYCVMEVSSHALDQKRVAGIDFSAAIFSNLSQDHLDYHGTMDNYAKAKKILFDNLNGKSIAISNYDDDYGEFMLSNTEAKKIELSLNNNFKIINNELIINGINYQNNLIGKYNAYNLLEAIVCLIELGFDKKEIQNACKTLKAPEGRMQIINLKNGAKAVVDYAHTPDALEKALQALNENKSGKLMCVFGCGGDRDRTKRPLMGKAAYENSDIAIATSDNPRTENPEEIIADIIQGNEDKFEIEIDRKKAILLACEKSSENDVILIAGKGHEKYQIIGTKKIHFDDVEIINEFNSK